MNAGLAVDLPQLAEAGASGIGLFRTELQFMVASTFPRAEAQERLYRDVLDAARDKPVTFRTIDIGGDKVLPYFKNATTEENPALGWRAIRLTLDRPGLLRTQIRALLKAAGGRELRVMLPMVTELGEISRAREIIDKEVRHLSRFAHHLPTSLKLGAMLEVPSLLYQLDELMAAVDFVSVGSNDLFQFVMATDRGNTQLSDRFDPLSVPFLRVLKQIADAGETTGTPVTLCGELAGKPISAMALIGLGYRSISMSAAAIGPVKAMLTELPLPRAEDIPRRRARQGRRAAATCGANCSPSPRRTAFRYRDDSQQIMISLPRERMDQLVKRFDMLEAQMAAGPVAETYVKLASEYSELQDMAAKIRELLAAEKEIADLEAMLADRATDAEMRALAQAEMPELDERIEALQRDIQLLLLPKDEADDKNAILEIRAGTGGDEASLFAGDLFRMYERYAAARGWKVEVASASEGEVGGYKEIIATVSGKGVFAHLKFESGVHRVQRVPATEAGGRIHTSAATVAVLPEAAGGRHRHPPEDIRIDTMRASGAGGQHVNTTDFGGAHHPSAERHHRGHAGREIAAPEPGARHADSARAALRSGAHQGCRRALGIAAAAGRLRRPLRAHPHL